MFLKFKMSNTTTDIMDKLYGSNATQMMGGAKKAKKQAKPVKKTVKKTAKKIRGGEKIEMCPYPEYITNENFKRFMSSFYLIKNVCHAYSSTIYIIPPKAKLEKMISEFEKTLKANKIAPNTLEAYRYASTNDLPYKRCIFNVFADSTPETYRLDEAKKYRNFGLTKRTNLLKEQYFFQYNSESEITIYPSAECVSKEGQKAKLIACCDKGIYVFEGELPAPKLIYQKQVVAKGLLGGANVNEVKLDMLKEALKKGEAGAYKYVCSFALAEYLDKHNHNVVSKNFSGDLIHSAFRVAFDDEVTSVPKAKFSNGDLSKTFDHLLKNFKLSKTSINAPEVQKSFKVSYLAACKKNSKPADVSKAFIASIKKKYSKIGMETLKADIACNLYNMGYANDVAAILSICKSVDEPSATALESASVIDYDSSDNEIFSSKLAKLLCRSLCMAPLIGVVSKSYYPIKCNYKELQTSVLNGGFFDEPSVEETEEVEESFEEKSVNEEVEKSVDEVDEVEESVNEEQIEEVDEVEYEETEEVEDSYENEGNIDEYI